MAKITLKLSPKQLDIIGNALGMRPFVEVVELIDELRNQVKADGNGTPPPAATPPTDGGDDTFPPGYPR